MKFVLFIALLACAFAGCNAAENSDDLVDDTVPIDDPVKPVPDPLIPIPADGGSGDSAPVNKPVSTHFEVSTYDDGSPLPVTFKIDCSRLQDPTKLDCKKFIELTARKAFPALRKITGINLEQRCPTMSYVIFNASDWPHGGAGGMSLGNCQTDYLVDVLDLKYFDPTFGVYDSHELLHQHQYLVSNLLNDSHPFFESTLAEVAHLVNDQYSYQYNRSNMQAVVSNTAPPAVCRQAQEKVEDALYLKDTNVVYGFYQNLNADITDTSTLVSYMFYLASGKDQNVVNTLSSAGCSVAFPKR